jgi:hypothetical protein
MDSHNGMIVTGEKEAIGETPVPVPLCPPQIPHVLIMAQTWDSSVRGRQPNLKLLRENAKIKTSIHNMRNSSQKSLLNRP